MNTRDLSVCSLVLFAVSALLGSPSPARQSTGSQSPENPSRPVPVVSARVVSSVPGHRAIVSIREWRDRGGRVDWIRKDDWIAFDQMGENGTYEIYRIKLDGGYERCLTCENYDLRKLSSFSPRWHPSGEYLVFQVQSLPRKQRPSVLQLTTPHRALHSELWVMTADGRRSWQITKIGRDGGALMEPLLSHEASQLAWSERVATRSKRSGPWGEWVVRVAELSIRRGLPKLGKVRTYEPEALPGLILASGFTADDRGLLVTAPPTTGTDIVRLDLETRELERLTTTTAEHEGLASLSPRDDLVVYSSDRSIGREPGQRLPRRTDLWIMRADGGRKERLTYFNHPRSQENVGEALIGDVAWGPDGESLLVQLVRPGIDGEGEESLFLVTLDRQKLL